MRFIQHPETGEIIPANEYVRPHKQRSDLAAPSLISDHMADTWHPHNGREYSSKSEFRAVTKASGGEETGNDRQVATKHVDMTVKHDVGEAVRMLKEGYKPAPAPEAKEGWS